VPFYIETLVFLGFAIDEHIGYLSGVRVTQSLILCVCFVDRFSDPDSAFVYV
jgi:hypothetical protein